MPHVHQHEGRVFAGHEQKLGLALLKGTGAGFERLYGLAGEIGLVASAVHDDFGRLVLQFDHSRFAGLVGEDDDLLILHEEQDAVIGSGGHQAGEDLAQDLLPLSDVVDGQAVGPGGQ